jgi:hypothetical protein
MAETIEKSLLDLDFASLTRRGFRRGPFRTPRLRNHGLIGTRVRKPKPARIERGAT